MSRGFHARSTSSYPLAVSMPGITEVSKNWHGSCPSLEFAPLGHVVLYATSLMAKTASSLTMFHCPSFSGLEPETLDLQYQFCHSKYSMHKSIVSIE